MAAVVSALGLSVPRFVRTDRVRVSHSVAGAQLTIRLESSHGRRGGRTGIRRSRLGRTRSGAKLRPRGLTTSFSTLLSVRQGLRDPLGVRRVRLLPGPPGHPSGHPRRPALRGALSPLPALLRSGSCTHSPSKTVPETQSRRPPPQVTRADPALDAPLRVLLRFTLGDGCLQPEGAREYVVPPGGADTGAFVSVAAALLLRRRCMMFRRAAARGPQICRPVVCPRPQGEC